MADIFDEIEQGGDIFDQVASATVRPVASPEMLGKVQQTFAQPKLEATQTVRVPFEQKPKSMLGRLKQAYRRGGQSASVDLLYHKVAMGQLDYDTAKKAETEFNRLQQTSPIEAKNWLDKLVLTTAQIAKPMVMGSEVGLPYGVAGAGMAAAAGQAGPQALTPEEVVTVPGAFAAGTAAGSTKFWSEQGSGSVYREARNKGVSHKVASIAASLSGPLYGWIEQSQVAELIPGMNKLKKSLYKKAITAAVKLAKEVGEEGAQQLVTDNANTLARLVEKQIDVTDLPAEAKKNLINSLQAMKQAVGPLALLGGPGLAVSLATPIETGTTPEVGSNEIVAPGATEAVVQSEVTEQIQTPAEAAPEFVTQPEGVAMAESVETEQMANNMVGLRAKMDVLLSQAEQVQSELDTTTDPAEQQIVLNKLNVLRHKMDRIDAGIKRIDPDRVATMDTVALKKLAKRQGVTIPTGATAQTIRQLLQGPMDVAKTEKGYVANVSEGETEVKWSDQTFDTEDEAIEHAISGVRQNVKTPTKKTVQRNTKQRLRAVGHKVAKAAGIYDKPEYRDLARNITGKTSMKAMTRAEMEQFVAALEDAYGAAAPLTKADYEIPVTVGDNVTTMATIINRGREAVANLIPKKRTKGVAKLGAPKESKLGRVKRFLFTLDNTPIFHLARILDNGEEGIYSEVLDHNMEKARRVKDGFLRSGDNIITSELADAGITPQDMAKLSKALNPRTRLHQFIREAAATTVFQRKINGKSFNFTWGRAMDFYLATNQEDGLRHVREGGWVIDGRETDGWSDEEINSFRDEIENNEQVMTAVNAILKVGRELWRPGTNQVSQRLEGKDIATIDDWWGLEVWQPNRVKGKTKPSQHYEVPSLIENQGIFHDRTRSKAPLVMRDAFNRYTVFNQMVAEYVGYADAARTARTLLNNTELSSALEQKGYGPVVDRIVKIQNRAQGATISNDQGPLTSFMREHLPGLYRAVLVVNPRVIASQFTSTFNYGAYVSSAFITNIKDGLSWKNIQDTIELSDIAWSRFHMGHSSLELGEMAKSDAALRAWTGGTADINKLGWSLKVSDAAALAAGMKIAQAEYTDFLGDKLTGLSAEWWADKSSDLPDMTIDKWKEIQAKQDQATQEERQAAETWRKAVTKRAEFLWQRTQPSWDKWNRSVLTSQAGLERLILLFRSFHEKSLTIFNEAKLDYGHSSKKLEDKARFVQRTSAVMTGYAVNAALRVSLGALVAREIPDMYKFLKAIVTSWMAMFPVFGKTLDDSARRFLDAATDHKPEYRGQPIELFPLQVINTTLKAGPDIAQAVGEVVNGDNEAAKEAMKKALHELWMGIGAMNGVPVYELNRAFKTDKEPRQRRPGTGARR